MYTLKGGGKVFGDTLEELKTKVSGKFDSNKVTRVKGYGELNAPDVKAVAMDPKTRRLIRITDLVKPGDLEKFLSLVGRNTDDRKTLLGLN